MAARAAAKAAAMAAAETKRAGSRLGLRAALKVVAEPREEAAAAAPEEWAQCDDCEKWRRVACAVDPNLQWVCRFGSLYIYIYIYMYIIYIYI